MLRIVALRIAVSLHRARLCGRGSKRLALLVLTMIIFSKFTEARFSSYPPHGNLFLFGHAETNIENAAAPAKTPRVIWIQDKYPQLGAALAYFTVPKLHKNRRVSEE
jgi:hypothetical protein